ncbi:hypothetical protein [Lysinibacillus odysseyi]|uniref:Uncharacterized protein n=1 Tax=Lysinibacillus odysseyi 34hs-1 = NBRC 100172 TaxID=1220589 RepID=A0A0A3JBY1_9BACI|nr:hypothetical protein [Lysinibacillus odysseyi]KGR84537.1 hypothetical protein CD32_13250 [Lysinibacillus odysseyi 34hs-1 = NBRC 100172]
MKKTGSVLMFIGAVMLAIFMYADLKLTFGLWATGFIISMLIAAVGAITLIIYFAKGIRDDNRSKNSSK